MASITGNGSKGHHSFTLEVNEVANSQNITNNTSDVSFTFKIAAITSGYNWSGWASKIKYTITINGTTYTDSIGSYNGSSTVTLKSGTQTIQHNNDGTKTISFSFSVTDTSGASYTCGNASASGSLTLTTIPRNSTISSITGGTIGQTLTVNINRASSNYTHEVKVTYGSKTQTLSTSATTSASGTLEMSFCNQITNNTSASAIVTLLTKDGNTYVGDPVNQLVTITVPSSVVPTISSVTKSDTANLSSIYGAYVQGKSSLRVVTNSSGAYGSSISSTTVAIKSGNTTIRTLNGSDVTFPNITNTGTITVLVTVKDSRNRSATNSSTITVATYNNPQISLFSAERLNNDDTVTLKWNASITNINNSDRNTIFFNIYKRQKGTSSWGSAIYSSSSSYTYSSNGSTTSCDSNQAWEFKFDAQDSFTTTTTIIEVGTAFELINWGADGTSMAIGKVASNSNTLEVALKTKLLGDVTSNVNMLEKIIVGNIQTKNIAGPWLLGGINSTTGADAASDTSRRTAYIPVDFTTTTNYRISRMVGTSGNIFINAYNASKQSLGRTNALNKSSITELTLSSGSFTGGTAQGTGAIKYLRITVYSVIDGANIDSLVSNIQLEEGNTTTTFYENKGIGYVSGSNANGNYIKFDDGIMVQWNSIGVLDQAISNSYGSLYQGTRVITYPIPFIIAPSVTCSQFRWGTGASWGSVDNIQTSTVTLRGIDIQSRSAGTTVRISWMAIGRWK